MIHETLEKLQVPIESLRPYHRNPRQGDVGAIMQSLEHHGQYRPIVVNSRTQEVLAGNHTLEAARQLGWNQIAATFVDVDEDQAARIVLIDNRSTDLAAYDDAVLAELIDGRTHARHSSFDAARVTARHPMEQDATDSPVALARARLGMSQAELARLARVGRNTVWRIEAGRVRVPHRTTQAVLAMALDVPADELFPEWTP